MPELRFFAYDIDEHILEKILIKHGISLDEVDEAFYNSDMHVWKTRGGLYKLLSQTDAGRYVVLIAADNGEGDWRIATAREMSQTERRQFRRG